MDENIKVLVTEEVAERLADVFYQHDMSLTREEWFEFTTTRLLGKELTPKEMQTEAINYMLECMIFDGTLDLSFDEEGKAVVSLPEDDPTEV